MYCLPKVICNCTEHVRIALAGNNPHSFSTAIKPIVTNMSREGVSIENNSFSKKTLITIKGILMFVRVNIN